MASLRSLHPDLEPWARALVQLAGQAHLRPRITSTLRSRALQARLYRRYLSGRSAYPVAPPGTSAHEFGLAFDVVVSPMSALADLGALWESWGGVWGGHVKDPVHFEAPGASGLAQRSASAFERASSALEQVPWYIDLPLSIAVPPYGALSFANTLYRWFR